MWQPGFRRSSVRSDSDDSGRGGRQTGKWDLADNFSVAHQPPTMISSDQCMDTSRAYLRPPGRAADMASHSRAIGCDLPNASHAEHAQDFRGLLRFLGDVRYTIYRGVLS